MRRPKKFVLSTLFLVMLGFVLVGLSINRNSTPMKDVKWDFVATLSDIELENIFSSHRDVFVKLAADVKSTNKEAGVFHRGGMGHEKLTPQLRQQLCDSLEQAGIKWALIKWEKDSNGITIEILPSHPDEDGLIRSLYHSTNSLGPLKQNLSGVTQRDIGTDKRWFMQIAPQWFIAANNIDYVGE